MLDNLSNQKRVLLASVMTLVFFLLYDYFYLSKIRASYEQNKTMLKQESSYSKNNGLSINKPVNNTKSLVDIKSGFFDAKIDSLGRISSFVLKDKKFIENGKQIDLIDPNNELKPLEVRFVDPKLNELAFLTPYTSNLNSAKIGEKIVLTQNLGSFSITKTIKFNKFGSYELDVKIPDGIDYFISSGSRPNIQADAYSVHGVLLINNKGNIQTFEDGSIKENKEFSDINVAAALDRYYTTLFYNFDKNLNTIVTQSPNKSAEFFIKANKSLHLGGFIGPKEHKILKSINKELTNVVEYGFFTFIAKPMFALLNFLHNFTGNWGWAIVLLTICVRIVLFYPTYKGMMSMNKLKDLAPKIKELQEKYKGDPQKMQIHMMELYKKNGANPMSGCLPILLQIPIFFAIYKVLLNTIELKGAPWILWIHDLSIKDPYYILPIVMGALMFLQQKITPSTISDPTQAKIMKYLPIIFTLFFFTFPAGLTLYWSVNNFASLVQQFIINKKFEKQKEEEIAEKRNEN